jgi:hypothetical protein
MRRFGYLAVLSLAGMAQSAVLAQPPTLDEPGKKCRFISLAEARAIALEQGHVGQPSLLFTGRCSDNRDKVPDESLLHDADSIRVLAGGKSGSKSIVITGIRRHPRPAEFERNVDQMLLNVEVAYWNLYGSYWQLYSREEALRLAYETWKMTGAQLKVGRVSRASVAQAEGQYNLCRSQRLQALDTVLDNERQLRAMLGMHIKDGTRLVPSDAPTLVEQKPDWKEGWRCAMKNRPEMHLARKDVEKARLEVQTIRLTSNIWKCLFGQESTDKHVCCSPSFTPNCWTTGDAKDSSLRQAQLKLASAYLVLQDQELKTERFLGLYYRRMSSAYFQFKAARAQCEAFGRQLEIRHQLYRAGANEPSTSAPMSLNLLLESQRFWAESLATECQAIVTYNNALAGWEFGKGDIMKHAHVRLGEEPPRGSDSAGTAKWSAARAVVREHMRTLRHVRHETAVTADSPLSVLQSCSAETAAKAPSLPALWKSFPPIQKVGDVETGLVEGRKAICLPPRRQDGVSP